jgi:DNA-directed RNA polymerase alpha subunit
VHKALVEAGLASIGDVVKKLEAGDRELLAVEGFGPKALEEVKGRLEAIGLVPA